MKKRRNEAKIEQGIMGLPTGTIGGFEITKQGVIRKKKNVSKRRKKNR